MILDICRQAVSEDLGDAGDITTNAVFASTVCASAVIKSKEAGVVSGIYLMKPLFGMLSPDLTVDCCVVDGAPCLPQTVFVKLRGPVRAILAGERVALNFLQRLSGIATATARLKAAIAHTKAELLDTRKTTPLLRAFEKQAVVHGGGVNHRFGLFDMVLLKDTHVAVAGGPGAAVRKAESASLAPGIKIEVEIQSVGEFVEVIAEKPDRIMLDNMSCIDMARCVDIRNECAPGLQLEASGNVTLETIAKIAETGVDFISCGAITHSIKALDIHLVIKQD